MEEAIPFLRTALRLSSSDFSPVWRGWRLDKSNKSLVFRDVPYVAGETNKKLTLDVFVPKMPFPRPYLPVLVFFHGGAWVRGDKSDRSALIGIYSNVGVAAARLGCVGVVANYRLAHGGSEGGVFTSERSAVGWKDQVLDVATALAFVKGGIRRFGGDPKNITCVGHSAGAHLSATALSDPGWLEEGRVRAGVSEEGTIRNFVGMSGPYDFTTLRQTIVGGAVLREAFGDDDPSLGEACPLYQMSKHGVNSLLRQTKIGCVALTAEDDFFFDRDADKLLKTARNPQWDSPAKTIDWRSLSASSSWPPSALQVARPEIQALEHETPPLHDGPGPHEVRDNTDPFPTAPVPETPTLWNATPLRPPGAADIRVSTPQNAARITVHGRNHATLVIGIGHEGDATSAILARIAHGGIAALPQ